MESLGDVLKNPVRETDVPLNSDSRSVEQSQLSGPTLDCEKRNKK